MIVLIWAIFIFLWIIYPIYFFFLRNKISHYFYRSLLLLLPVLGFIIFTGKLNLSSDLEGLFIFNLNFLVFSFHFIRKKPKASFMMVGDLVVLCAYLFFAIYFLAEFLNFRLFHLSDDQTGSLLGAIIVLIFLVFIGFKARNLRS